MPVLPNSCFSIVICRNGHSNLFTALSHPSDPKRESVSSSLFNLWAESLKKTFQAKLAFIYLGSRGENCCIPHHGELNYALVGVYRLCP